MAGHLRSSETCATGEAHSSVVRATPTRGSSLRMRLTTLGKHSLASTPSTVGISTTCSVEMARPCRQEPGLSAQLMGAAAYGLQGGRCGGRASGWQRQPSKPMMPGWLALLQLQQDRREDAR